MTSELQAACWPGSRLGEAMGALARAHGLSTREAEAPVPPGELGEEALEAWMGAAARHWGLDVEPRAARYSEVEELAHSATPALVPLPAEGGPRYLALLRARAGLAYALGPDLVTRALPLGEVLAALRSPREVEATGVERMLEQVGVPERRRARARGALLRGRLGSRAVGTFFSLYGSPGAPFGRQLRQAGLLRHLVTFIAAHVAQYALLLLSWWLIGREVFSGRLELGWLAAWALLLLTLVPLRLLSTRAQGRFALGVGRLLKTRLLAGSLRLEPEEIRHQGVGQLLARVNESGAVESLALSGGLQAVVSLAELLLAGVVLASGQAGALHALLLGGWAGLTLWLGWRYHEHHRRCVEARLELTNDLVEKMVGHRTRLVQDMRSLWHEREDGVMERYLRLQALRHRSVLLLQGLVPRGWLLLGLAATGGSAVLGGAAPAMLAVSVGGVLLAYRALGLLAEAAVHLVGAGVAWRQVASLFAAAARSEPPGEPTFSAPPSAEPTPARPLLEASNVSFRHPGRPEPVLSGCSLQLATGDRLLLEGPSGGGKSTLASLLCGLRTPGSGIILLQGADRHTLGAEAWRRRVVAVPQFHENHVFTGTLAFNLLMGRRWPAQDEDFRAAEAVCRQLGLGELLDRMPAGLMQVVGDTGWQLSHGERSRLFIARALLQSAQLLVMDESFAALDPESLERCLVRVLESPSALLVIAHP